MNIWSGSRASGKTTKAVEWVKATEGAVLMVHSEAEAKRVMHEYHLDRSQVCSIVNVRNLRGRKPEARLVIDNLDLFFWHTVGTVPEIVTMPDWPVEHVGPIVHSD